MLSEFYCERAQRFAVGATPPSFDGMGVDPASDSLRMTCPPQALAPVKGMGAEVVGSDVGRRLITVVGDESVRRCLIFS